MDMLCLGAKATPVGYVKLGDSSCTVQQLARIAGECEEVVTALLEELRSAGVYSTTRIGVIYCRRMVREAKSREKAVLHGKKGGNPSLSKTRIKPQGVNPKPTPPVKDGDNPPEARSQKPEARNPQSPLAADPGGGGGGGAKSIVDWFLAERNRLWPNDPNLPSPTMTMKTLAQQHIDAGGSVELIKEILTRGMEKRAQMKQSSPSSIAAFAKSIGDETAKIKNATGSILHGHGHLEYVSQNDRELDKHRAWMALWEQSGRTEWPVTIRGPAPGQLGCVVRKELLKEHGL